MRQVPDIAAVEIDRLRKDGVVLSDDDIVWLASLGWRIENPKGQTMESAGLSEGTRLSNGETLFPLTVSASRWLHKYGPVFSENADLFAVAFAMIFPGRVAKLKTAKESVSAVGEWADSLTISHAELVRAVGRMLSSDAPHDPDAEPEDTDRLIASLVAITGLPFEYWNSQSWAQVGAAYSGAIKYALLARDNIDNPDAADSRAALRSLLLAIKEIRERK